MTILLGINGHQRQRDVHRADEFADRCRDDAGGHRRGRSEHRRHPRSRGRQSGGQHGLDLLGSTNADATFSFAPGSPLSTATTPAGIVIANFTGGNVPSLAVTNEEQSTRWEFTLVWARGVFESAGNRHADTPFGDHLRDADQQRPARRRADRARCHRRSGRRHNHSRTPRASPPDRRQRKRRIPGAEFVDLGVKVKATPTLHPNHEVTLQLEFEIRALAGSEHQRHSDHFESHAQPGRARAGR